MRAKVVAKTMTKELIFAGFGIICAIGMPLYYLKLQRIKREYSEKY